jgi:hypothetical protein
MKSKKPPKRPRLPRLGFLRLRHGGVHDLKRKGIKGYSRRLNQAFLVEAIADTEDE